MNKVLSLFLLFPICIQAKVLCEGAVCESPSSSSANATSGLRGNAQDKDLTKEPEIKKEKTPSKTKTVSEKKSSHKKSQKSPPVYEPEEETNLPPYFRNLKGYSKDC